MALDIPYSREGNDPDLAWNEVIRQINELAGECGVDPLPLVDGDHRWSQSDIQEAQDKLLELCDEFNFDPPPSVWKQSTVTALIEAINEGTCCCEEEDKDDFGDHVGGMPPFIIAGTGSTPGSNFTMLDWARWIMSTTIQRSSEQIACPAEPGETPVLITRYSGGRGWVGREFSRWEMHIFDATAGGPTTPIAEGDVVAGYIVIGEGTWQAEATCENPTPGAGTPLGLADPAWGFPYLISSSTQAGYTISGQDGRSKFSPWSADIPAGFLEPSWVTSPYTFYLPTGHDVDALLRLKCE